MSIKHSQILKAEVHSAQIHDSTGAYSLLEKCLKEDNFSDVQKVLADTGYQGDLGEWFQKLAKDMTGKKSL